MRARAAGSSAIENVCKYVCIIIISKVLLGIHQSLALFLCFSLWPSMAAALWGVYLKYYL